MPQPCNGEQDRWIKVRITGDLTYEFVWAWLTDLLYEWRDALLVSLSTAASAHLASRIVDAYAIGFALFNADTPRDAQRRELLMQSKSNAMQLVLEHQPDLGTRMIGVPVLPSDGMCVVAQCLSSFPTVWTTLAPLPADDDSATSFNALRRYCGALIANAIDAQQLRKSQNLRSHRERTLQLFGTDVAAPDINRDERMAAPTPSSADDAPPTDRTGKVYVLTSWQAPESTPIVSAVLVQFDAMQRHMLSNADAIRAQQQTIRHIVLNELKDMRQIVDKAIEHRLIANRLQQHFAEAKAALFGHLRYFSFTYDVPDINRLFFW